MSKAKEQKQTDLVEEEDDEFAIYDEDNKKNKIINSINLDDPDKDKYSSILFNQNESIKDRQRAVRDSKIDSSKIKKFITQNYNIPMSDFFPLILAVVSKVYIGELIEEARAIMTQRGEIGNIKPEHLRLAFNELIKQGKLDFEPMNLKKIFE